MYASLSFRGPARPTRRPPVISYYKGPFLKKEELFANFVQSAAIFFQQTEREAQDPQKFGHALRPEVPQRAQKRRQQRKGDRRADDHRKEHIQPQLPVSDAQREGGQRNGKHDAEKRVGHAGRRSAALPAEPADRTQRVVEQGEARAEQERFPQGAELRADLYSHNAQPPNRRLSRPPEPPDASS